ncbi:MAG: uracil-DNA glycosylase [Chloroflexota bacterium]|nr:MAG: uracil-DNA glycosylase [Chloroflexota bacterium]
MGKDNAATLAKIAQEIQVCRLCRLYQSATKAVPGAGNPKAELLFIGEGPGFYEDKSGLPFVGQSGKYLEQLLAMIGLTRDDVFITNVVKHRPPENRDPLPDEIAACKNYLDRQIEIIDPLVIATLGRHSMSRYFPNGKITKIHGVPKYDEYRAYYPLFHPAAVLRNPSWQQDMEQDFRRLPEVLEKVREMRATRKSPSTPADDGPLTQLSLF